MCAYANIYVSTGFNYVVYGVCVVVCVCVCVYMCVCLCETVCQSQFSPSVPEINFQSAGLVADIFSH